jgi:hypothetical protein
MKSILSSLTLAAGTLIIAGCASTSTHDNLLWGSLAIDSNQGRAYGLSYDYPNPQEADARALKECGTGCHVVKNFATGCGAYATDQARGGTASGWGIASSEKEAKDIALNYCRQYRGINCMIRVWSCNSN